MTQGENHEPPKELVGHETCPNCGAGWKDFDVGFGLAGGGYGPYMYCNKCGTIIHKSQEPIE